MSADRGSAGTERSDRGPSWTSALRLAAAGGRADRARIALTALAAAAGTMMMLSAATVAAITDGRGGDGPFTSAVLNQPGLRQGVVVTLLALCLPLLVFVGQCARVGAPARDRRIAALRLSGATPADVVRIAAGETALAAALGTVTGLALFSLLRLLLDRVVIATYTMERQITDPNGSIGYVTDSFTGPARPLPTNVWPDTTALVAVMVLLPVFSALFTVLAMRRVVTTPFGVVRREQRPPLRLVPAVLFGIGLAGTMLLSSILRLAHVDYHDSIPVAEAVGGVFALLLVMILAGLLLGTSALSAALGSKLVGSGRVSWLLAGRRLLAAPGQASRANSALLMLVLIAAFLQGVAARFDVGPGSSTSQGSYDMIVAMLTLATFTGAAIAVASMLVGSIEHIVSRRQVIAGMSAVGVPLSVIRRAVVIENILPLAPTVLVATASGILSARGVMATRVNIGTYNPSTGASDLSVAVVHVPWAPLVLIAVTALLLIGSATVACLPLLRTSADPAELRSA